MILEGNESFPFFLMKTQSNVALAIMNGGKGTLTVKEKTVNSAELQDRIDFLRKGMSEDIETRDLLIHVYNKSITNRSDNKVLDILYKRFSKSVKDELEYRSTRVYAANSQLKKLMEELMELMEE